MKTKSIDYSLFFVVFAMMIFWMVMISSVSVYPSFKVTSAMVALNKLKEPNNYFYLIRNISHVVISLIALSFFAKTPYKNFEKYAKQIFLAVIMFLIAVLLIWVTYNWAKWWINIPFIPFSIQPAEFLKLWLITYFAYFLKRKKSEINDFKEWFIPFMMILSAICLLLALQPDFWTILIIVPISFIMLFAWWWNIKHLAVIIWLSFVFAWMIYWIWKMASSWETWKTKNSLSYISERFDNFLSDNKSSIQNKTINFQTLQWLIAIWSWWFFWLGFGKSIQKFWYLPEVEWDFIFSVIWEELWFMWILCLLWLFLFLAYRWLAISERVSDPFWKYMAIWITSWIMVQAFVNIWVNLNIVPLTWVTLPFISYGWSSLLSLMIWIWVMLNISRDSEYEKAKIEKSKSFRRNKVSRI